MDGTFAIEVDLTRTDTCTQRCQEAPIPICVCTDFERAHELLDSVVRPPEASEFLWRAAWRKHHDELMVAHGMKSCNVCNPRVEYPG